MTIKEIVEKYLTDNGFDGLFYDDECSCCLDNLFYCAEYFGFNCQPGYKRINDNGIYKDKDAQWNKSE